MPGPWRILSALGVPLPSSAATDCAALGPVSIWEAAARGCATFRENPPAFGYPILYPAFVGDALFIQVDSEVGGPIVLEGDEFVALSDAGAQDAFLHPAPRDTRTAGYWSSWDNHLTEEFMARFTQAVNDDSILFGPDELFGEVTPQNASALLKVGGRSSALDKLRRQLLATWLDIEASYLPITSRIEPMGIPGASVLLGPFPRALHVDPVDKPPTLNPRGGVIGTVEEMVLAGGLDDAEIETFKNLLDAINNDVSGVVVDGLVIEPHQTWETLLAQQHSASVYARILGEPLVRQPPGLASVWFCTEGLSLSQGVATADFMPSGQIIPDAIRDIVDDLAFGIAEQMRTDQPAKTGSDHVRLTVGRKVYDIAVDYDGAMSSEDQFLRFLTALTRGTGLELTTKRLDRFGFTWRYAVLRSSKHWKVENIESDGPPWLRSGMPSVSPDVYASYGEPAQHLVWFYLEDNPAVLVGKTPLYGSPPHEVRVGVTNIGQIPSGPIVLRDTIPAGLDAADFSIAPDGIVPLPGGARMLTWELPSLDGSQVGGIHPSLTIDYSLTGTVSERTMVPGATAEWAGQSSRSADVILVP